MACCSPRKGRPAVPFVHHPNLGIDNVPVYAIQLVLAKALVVLCAQESPMMRWWRIFQEYRRRWSIHDDELIVPSWAKK
jgi:hypothetical protein